MRNLLDNVLELPDVLLVTLRYFDDVDTSDNFKIPFTTLGILALTSWVC